MNRSGKGRLYHHGGREGELCQEGGYQADPGGKAKTDREASGRGGSRGEPKRYQQRGTSGDTGNHISGAVRLRRFHRRLRRKEGEKPGNGYR